MKAVVYKNKNQVAVEEVENPRIEHPSDAVVRVTSAGICGSDLHMYDGRTDISSGTVFGHEIMGVIDDVGQAVVSLKKGDRVVLPFNISCGFCFNCIRGYTNACLTTNPEKPSAAYGYAGMGPYRGGQAEYVRVPFADFNATKLPGEAGDAFEDDFLLLSDVFPTGYHATELAQVGPGKTVAIFGAGPVGLLAAHSAIIKGASEVYVVDRSEERLAIAEKIGAFPVNFEDGSPAEQIITMRKNNKMLVESFKPGEEKMMGVMCGIDAVGYQAHSIKQPDKEDPLSVINELAKVVNFTGHIGIVGVYMPQDPGAVSEQVKKGIYALPFGLIFDKGITIGTGQTPVKKYIEQLKHLIIAGKAKPGMIVSQHTAIEDAPRAYTMFDFRGIGDGEEYTKVIINP